MQIRFGEKWVMGVAKMGLGGKGGIFADKF